jgi:signal transduction histidine kinase
VLSATLVLVAVFAGSLWFALRAVRRESLAMRARSEFLTGVTHELKTPIASIRLVAEVLTEDQVTPAKQREYFGLLAGESARLSMLIENVLDLGQMERGERAYDLRPGDLAEVARDAAKLFAPLASQAGMQLLLHEGTERAAAIVDRGALQQALLAVLENARKYARDGGVLELSTRAEGRGFHARGARPRPRCAHPRKRRDLHAFPTRRSPPPRFDPGHGPRPLPRAYDRAAPRRLARVQNASQRPRRVLSLHPAPVP